MGDGIGDVVFVGGGVPKTQPLISEQSYTLCAANLRTGYSCMQFASHMFIASTAALQSIQAMTMRAITSLASHLSMWVKGLTLRVGEEKILKHRVSHQNRVMHDAMSVFTGLQTRRTCTKFACHQFAASTAAWQSMQAMTMQATGNQASHLSLWVMGGRQNSQGTVSETCWMMEKTFLEHIRACQHRFM